MKQSIKKFRPLDGIVFRSKPVRLDIAQEIPKKKHLEKKKSWRKFLEFFGWLLGFLFFALTLFLFRGQLKIPTHWLKWKIQLVPIEREGFNPQESVFVENQSDEKNSPAQNEMVITETPEEMEIRQQAEAKRWIEENAQNAEILNNAKKEMGEDWVMVQYEYEKQLANLEWIEAQTQYPEIMKKAKKEWGTDYEMVRYIYEEEVAIKNNEKK